MAPVSRTGMVGRRAERAALRSALDDARGGRGAVVLLAGDPGIGKTTLIEWLAAEAAPTDVRTLWGRCWEGGGVAAYWPWEQVLRGCLSDRSADELGREGAADVAHLVPELAARLGATAASPRADATGGRQRLFAAVTTLLLDTARQGPLLLAFDDLHAADEASLLLLAHFASGLDAFPVLVVGAYRDAEVRAEPRRERLLRRVAAYGQLLALDGLDEPDVSTLLQGVTGETETTTDVARRLHRATDGNPFFVLESARLLARGPRAADDRVRLPEEVHALLRRRVDALDERPRRVLGAAAVLGRDFDLRVLHQATGLSVEVLVDALTQAASDRVVDEVGLGRWSFAHALLREALYDELPDAERSRLHGQAGEAIELVHAHDLDAHVPELAHHFFASGDANHQRQAVRYCEAAGRMAAAAFAHEEAALQFGRALDVIGRQRAPDELVRGELLVSLGEAMARSGDFPGARATFRQAVKVARALGSPELLGRAALGVAGEIDTVSDDERVVTLREAVDVVPVTAGPLRARLLLALAGALHRGRPRDHAGEARELSDEAVDVARRSGDPATLRSVLLAWHLNAAFFGPETLDRRLAVIDEVVERSAAAGDERTLAQAHQWRAVDLFEAGDIPAMEAELDLAAGMARRLAEPFLIWATTYPRATLALLRGDLDEAERRAREALAVGERTEFTDVESMFSGQLFAIRHQQGRLAETESSARRRSQRLNRKQEDTTVFVALVCAELGRTEEARQAYDAVFADIVAGRQGMWVPLARAVLTDVCWLLGDVDGAAEVYDSMLPFAGRHVVNGIAGASHGSADHHLGRLATLLGRFDEAERHFELAHRMHARLGARTWLAHGQVAHARMLLERGHPDDVASAAPLLAAARRSFRSMGMRLYEERAAALLASVGAADRGTFRRDGGDWALEYRGVRTRLRDTRGLEYLAALLARPGQPLPATAVAGGNDPERARQSVTRAVRGTIRRIAERDPELARHLEATVRTGTVSSYAPDRAAPIVWDVAPTTGPGGHGPAEDTSPAPT